jgi:tetratricopeptide (TPR) repeat protein
MRMAGTFSNKLSAQEQLPQEQGDAARDIAGLRDQLDSNTDLFGPHHPRTLAAVHQLAIALWGANDSDNAIHLLNQALDCIAAHFGSEYSMRTEILCTLGEIMFEQGQLEQAGDIHREVLQHRVRQDGANHPRSLAVKGDLAAILFELGRDDEAAVLEQEAFECARTHLGKTHTVTCVLAWNRALNHQRRGDSDSARRIFADQLAWLLVEDTSGLEADQNIVRTMLAGHLNWDAATEC